MQSANSDIVHASNDISQWSRRRPGLGFPIFPYKRGAWGGGLRQPDDAAVNLTQQSPPKVHCRRPLRQKYSLDLVNQAGVTVTTTALKAGVFDWGSKVRGTSTLASG